MVGVCITMRGVQTTLLLLVSAASGALALGEPKVISFPSTSASTESEQRDGQAVFGAPASASSKDDFLIASKFAKHAAPLLLDSEDNEAIHVAAQSFAHDIYRVTGLKPHLYNDTLPSHVDGAIVVGSVSSKLIRSIDGASYAKELEGKWESYDARVLESPVKKAKKGLVVVGSDRVCSVN